MVDAIVVGGGVGGLAAAIALGSAGKSVVLLEAAPTLGGKAGTASVEGVQFDTGPSVLTLPDGIESLFRDAGEDWREHVTLRTLDHAFRYQWPDGALLDIAASLEQTLANVQTAFGSSAREELEMFLAYAKSIWDAVAPTFVYGPAPSWASVIASGPQTWWQALRIDAFRTMERAVKEHVREPHLRDVLLRYATYNGSDPRQAPATLHCIAHVELGLGSYGVQGGMASLVGALTGLARRVGVEIRTSTPVVRLETERGSICGVQLEDGTLLRAQQVVANTEARALRRLLDRTSAETPAAETTSADPPSSMSAWTAVARALRRPERPAHTLLFPDGYENEFADIFDRGILPRNPTVYCCAQEPAHGVSGWPEHEPVFVMVNAPTADLAVVPDGFAEDVRRRLVHAEVLHPADTFVWVRTPADLARRFPESNGSLYGSASHGWTAAFRRPPNKVAGVRGLYLASGTAHPGGGIPLAIQSGREAARLALKDGLVQARTTG